MKTIWVNNQQSTELILFFNGWGMDTNAIKHLDFGKFDVCMFYNYSDEFSLNIDLSKYPKIHVITWSFGTWVAAKVYRLFNFEISKTFVFNGTFEPIDEKYGISPRLFKQTLKNWSQKTRHKFFIRMLGGQKQFNEYQSILPNRQVENQKNELKNLYNQILNNKISELPTDCAIIGREDLIFTYKNQHNYWENKTKIIEMNLPHYPFYVFKKWAEIIALA